MSKTVALRSSYIPPASRPPTLCSLPALHPRSQHSPPIHSVRSNQGGTSFKNAFFWTLFLIDEQKNVILDQSILALRVKVGNQKKKEHFLCLGKMWVQVALRLHNPPCLSLLRCLLMRGTDGEAKTGTPSVSPGIQVPTSFSDLVPHIPTLGHGGPRGPSLLTWLKRVLT